MNKKVYCKYCKKFKIGERGEYCTIPCDKDTYYTHRTVKKEQPLVLNSNNECIYFSPNWIKQFKDFLEERRK